MIESENVIESNEDRSRIPIPSALLKYKISNLPDSFYYIADFLTEEEERDLLNEVGISWLTCCFISFSVTMIEISLKKKIKLEL